MKFTPNTESTIKEMLNEIGVKDVGELFGSIPSSIINPKLEIPEGISEIELLRVFKKLSKKNSASEYISFLGAGMYEHFIPSAVNSIISRSEFYTSYTPYQPEVSQGTLQSIFEYQSMVCELTGMDISNASLYDGATATAESAHLAVNFTGREKILVSQTVHPEYRQVLKTYFSKTVYEIPYKNSTTDFDKLSEMLDDTYSCVILQSPNFFGLLEDFDNIVHQIHKNGALFIMVFNPLSLGVLKTPGEYDADIACAEGQVLGNPVYLGGSTLGIFTCKEKFLRQIPGRLVGMTKDSQNRRGFVLTLQTREQHIRRAKASSNICTNHALNALAGAVYLSLLGKNGLREVADQNIKSSHLLFEKIKKIKGISPVFNGAFFNEFVIRTKKPLKKIFNDILKEKIIPGFQLEQFYPELKNCLLVCATEIKDDKELEEFIKVLRKYV